MKCPVCVIGETKAEATTVTLARSGITIVFKEVPAVVCNNCGEAFHSEDVSRAVLTQAMEAARAGVEVDVRRYRAV